MAMLFCDSFDHYGTLSQKWDTVTVNVPTISPIAARTGVAGMRFNTINGQNYALKNVTPGTTFFVGAAVNIQALPGAAGQIGIFFFNDSATGGTQVFLKVTPAGILQLCRAGGGNNNSAGTFTVLGSSANPISTGGFHYIECKVIIDPTVGVAECKVDGVFVIQLSGQNTRATANTNAGQIGVGTYLMNDGGGTIWYDDLYVNDATTTVNNTYLGDVAVECQFPNANGSNTAWAQNIGAWPASTTLAVGYTIVDSNGNVQTVTTAGTTKAAPHPTWSTTGGQTTTDNSVTWTCVGVGASPGQAGWMLVQDLNPDDDESYLSSSTAGALDSFLYPAVPSVTGTVFAVAVDLRARKDTAGVRSVRAWIKSPATTGVVADNGTDIPLSTSYLYYQEFFVTDPNTAAQWTISGVNAAEYGIKEIT